MKNHLHRTRFQHLCILHSYRHETLKFYIQIKVCLMVDVDDGGHCFYERISFPALEEDHVTRLILSVMVKEPKQL